MIRLMVATITLLFAPMLLHVLNCADERTGQLCCVLKTPEVATIVKSQLVVICRRMWSNPPNHGARIVATALNNPSLKQEW